MVTETAYRLLVAALLVGGFSISAFWRRRAARAGERVSRRHEGLIAIPLRLAGLAILGGLVVYLINPRWMAWSQIDLPASVRMLGAFFVALAILGCVWVFRHLGLNITDTVATRRKHTLVTTGPYRWVRHPLYLGGAVGFFGHSLLTASWFIAAAALAALGLLVLRTRIEEEKLIERFGDEYRRYADRTGQYLPRLWRRTSTTGATTSDIRHPTSNIQVSDSRGA